MYTEQDFEDELRFESTQDAIEDDFVDWCKVYNLNPDSTEAKELFEQVDNISI